MIAPTDLLDQLETEAAQGWPTPWWPQDREAAEHRTHGLTIAQDRALGRYVDLIAEAAA